MPTQWDFLFCTEQDEIYCHLDVLSMSFNEGIVAGIVVQLVNNISPSWLVILLKTIHFPQRCSMCPAGFMSATTLRKMFPVFEARIDESILMSCFREMTTRLKINSIS